MPTPPYRIETARLVLRCWEPSDAPALKEAIDASLEHLTRWMPWAHAEPQSLDEKIELLRGFRSRFDAGTDFVYGIFTRDEGEVVGGTGLHTRVGEDALEIGYWIRASRVRQGLAGESTAALTRVAFAVAGVDRVEIHVDPENEVSCRIPRRLGFAEEALLRRRLPPRRPGEPRRDMLSFVLFADEFGASPAAAASAGIAAFDAAGRQLL